MPTVGGTDGYPARRRVPLAGHEEMGERQAAEPQTNQGQDNCDQPAGGAFGVLRLFSSRAYDAGDGKDQNRSSQHHPAHQRHHQVRRRPRDAAGCLRRDFLSNRLGGGRIEDPRQRLPPDHSQQADRGQQRANDQPGPVNVHSHPPFPAKKAEQTTGTAARQYEAALSAGPETLFQ